METVISYLRCSTPEQALGDAERRQIAGGRRWAEARGIRYADDAILRDIGISAFRGKNRHIGALRGFLDAAREGRWPKDHILYVESVDRLSREEPLEAFDLFREIVRSGVRLAIHGDLYTREIVNREPGRLHAILAEMNRAYSESQMKSERIAEKQAARRASARDGGPPIHGRNCPAWLDLADGRYTLNPERAAIIARIFELCAGGLGNSLIAKTLNAEGHRAFRAERRDARTGQMRKSLGWQSGYIQQVLNSPAVLGEFQPHQYVTGKRVPVGSRVKLFPSLVPNFISEDLYQRARQATRGRRLKGGGRRGRHFSNLLIGLGRCSECGGSLILVDSSPSSAGPAAGRWRYLRCRRALNNAGCSNRVTFPYRKVEANLFTIIDVRKQLQKLVPSPPDNTAAEIAELAARIERRKTARDALFDELMEFSGSARDAAKRKIGEVTAEIDEAESRLRDLRHRAITSPEDDEARLRAALAMLENPDPAERFFIRARVNQLLCETFEAAVLHPDKRLVISRKIGAERKLEIVLNPDEVEEGRIVSRGGSWLAVRRSGGKTVLTGQGFKLVPVDCAKSPGDPIAT